ncbi:MAG: DNA polymerase III subunit delta [Bacteroidales bacterium]|jgi:DNA polymerase-3 subunit delta|nr:DNA polymerase III subunit delta [Bacteroidales bacterium]
MAALSFTDIMKSLQKKEYKPLYLLMGDEPFFIDLISNYLEENLMPEADRDFNQVVLYGNDKEVDVSQIIALCKEYPFTTPYRLIIVKEAKHLKNIKALADYAQKPSLTSILVICHKYGKVDARYLKPFEQNGVKFLSEQKKEYEMDKWVKSAAEQYHFTIGDLEAKTIAENIGIDLSRIDNEFKKLHLFLPSGSAITSDIIEKYIGISKEYNLFELKNAIAERNVTKSNKIAMNMAANIKNHSIVPIIANLNIFFQQILAYQLSTNKSSDTIASIFGANAYIQKINIGYASRYSLPSIIRIIALLREYDMKSKGVNSVAPEEVLLQELVCKIFD